MVRMTSLNLLALRSVTNFPFGLLLFISWFSEDVLYKALHTETKTKTVFLGKPPVEKVGREERGERREGEQNRMLLNCFYPWD